jgi:hypothetical protein
MSIKEIIAIVNNILKQQGPGPHRFSGEFYQTFKEKKLYYFFTASPRI